MAEKMLRGNVSVLAAYPEAFADPTAPTSAELNNQFVFTTNEDGMVFDISCASMDDLTLNMTDPDTDNSMTVCDISTVDNPTFDNYEASIDTLRDSSVTAAGVYNMARELFMAPDRPFYLIKVIGVAHGTAFAAGDVVSIYGFNTDYPIDVVDGKSMVRQGNRFKPSGFLLSNYTLVA